MSATRSLRNWCYPENIVAGEFKGACNRKIVDFLYSENDLSVLQQDQPQFAEIGIWKGAMSYQLAAFLNGRGTLHLFDYEDRVFDVVQNLRSEGYTNVQGYGSSYRILDSYNWQLMKLLRESDAPRFHFIYIDGAHTWVIDALAFLLCDRLLFQGGFMAFDDYDCTLRASSRNPAKFPNTSMLYTDEQIDAQQVKLIVDILVKRDSRYRQVWTDTIFQKIL